MSNILFQNLSSTVEGTVKYINEHVVEIHGVEQNLSGFKLCTANGGVYGDFTDFTTLYRELDENNYQLSNDGSVYQETPEKPAIPSYEPSLAELKEAKIAEMEKAEQETLVNGIDVDISTGSEHFALGDKDVIYLLGLQTMVASGQEQIPWHNSNSKEPCKFYSNADMTKIQQSAMEFIVYQETKLHDLTRFINSLTDKSSVKSITYNTVVPTEYCSDVMKAITSEE